MSHERSGGGYACSRGTQHGTSVLVPLEQCCAWVIIGMSRTGAASQEVTRAVAQLHRGTEGLTWNWRTRFQSEILDEARPRRGDNNRKQKSHWKTMGDSAE